MTIPNPNKDIQQEGSGIKFHCSTVYIDIAKNSNLSHIQTWVNFCVSAVSEWPEKQKRINIFTQFHVNQEKSLQLSLLSTSYALLMSKNRLELVADRMTR
jgi:hypothetical protein